MLKLLKNMRRKEVLMVLLCTVLVAVQVYFDLRLPDYMTDLTTLIKTSGATADILSVGVKMLGCTLASAVLAVGCGVVPGKGDLFDIRLEFLVLPFPVDDQPPAFTVFSQTAGCKGPHEDEFLRVLGQVDEAPGPGDAAVEF